MPAPSLKATIYKCEERDSVQLPITHVLDANGDIRILPSVVAKGYFDIDYRGGKLVFLAGKFIGLIPINDQVLIEIRPKVSVSDLARMLTIAGEDVGVLRFFEREYKHKKAVDESIVHLVVMSLLQQLRSVSQEGMIKEYLATPNTGAFKPRINFSKTIQRHWSRGIFNKTANDIFNFTKDHPLNRLVKYTLWYCGRYLKFRSSADQTRLELDFFYNLFESVPLDTSLSFVPAVRALLQDEKIPVLRSYYVDIAKTCLLLTEHRSVSMDISGDDISLLSFILNLEDIFEKYVRNILRGHVKTHSPTMAVLDGNQEGRGYLFHDSKAYDIKPDIIMKTNTAILLIADVKYKPKLSESDRYQAISHALSCGARRVVLILPALGTGPTGLVRRGQVHDAGGIEVYEYYMRLDTDLPAQEDLLATQISALAT